MLTILEIAKHAGYERRIISRIPKRYDEYGDELDADDVDEEADSAVAETNPYEGVKLERKKQFGLYCSRLTNRRLF